MRYVVADVREPLEFLSAGQFQSSRPWIHARREIDSHEIVIVTRGTLYIGQGEDHYAAGPGCVLLLLPGESHYGFRPSDEGLVFYWLHVRFPGEVRVSDDGLGPACRDCPNDAVVVPLFFRSANPERIEILFHQLQHLANSKLRYRAALPFVATSLLIEIAEQALPPDADGAAFVSDPLVAEIAEWIRVHATDQITVSWIADRYGYNRDYLSRLFKKATGMNLQEYIVHQKLARAKALLAGTTRTVKQIAHEVGFSDAKSFIRLFRKHERLTPTGYRSAYFRKHLNNQ